MDGVVIDRRSGMKTDETGLPRRTSRDKCTIRSNDENRAAHETAAGATHGSELGV